MATIGPGADGMFMRHSYLNGSPSSDDILWLMIHEIRHNLGHDHGGSGDYGEVDNDTAFNRCASPLRTAALLLQTSERNFVTYLKQLVSEVV